MESIPAAKLISTSKAHIRPGKLLVTELWFEVPLNYSKPELGTIKLFARTVTRYEKPIVEQNVPGPKRQRPFLVYLQGGPGAGNPAPQDSPLCAHMLDRGYDLVFLDYRGVGYSSAISAATLELIGPPKEQAEYLKLFRSDTLVKDCEAVRQCLTNDYPPDKKKWSLFGHSFGGHLCLTYLSFHPEGVRECFITGGLGNLSRPLEEVYEATYKKVLQRNDIYYSKYPEDVLVIQGLASKIRELGGLEGILLPTGGRLTVQRLMTLGFQLGGDGGVDRIHDLITKMKADLDIFGFITRATLNSFDQSLGWDVTPIYAMSESFLINGPGRASNWAAERVGKSLAGFEWIQQDWKVPETSSKTPLLFSGGMIYPFLFDTCFDLAKIKETAQLLAEFDEWPLLYDEKQLAQNEVPVYAACYEDMYVDPGIARETASKIKGIKVFETNVLYHSALTHKSADLFRELLRLRDDVLD